MGAHSSGRCRSRETGLRRHRVTDTGAPFEHVGTGICYSRELTLLLVCEVVSSWLPIAVASQCPSAQLPEPTADSDSPLVVPLSRDGRRLQHRVAADLRLCGFPHQEAIACFWGRDWEVNLVDSSRLAFFRAKCESRGINHCAWQRREQGSLPVIRRLPRKPRTECRESLSPRIRICGRFCDNISRLLQLSRRAGGEQAERCNSVTPNFDRCGCGAASAEAFVVSYPTSKTFARPQPRLLQISGDGLEH